MSLVMMRMEDLLLPVLAYLIINWCSHLYTAQMSLIFSYIGNTLLEQNDCSLVVGDDFNAVLDPSLDISNSDAIANPSSTLLNTLVSDLNLVYIWRMQNATARDYTFFSNRHKTFSRVAYLLVSPTLIAKHTSITILQILLSYHSALLCNVDLPNIRTKAPRWRLNSSLLTGILSSLKVQLKDFWDINTKECSTPQILWEDTKFIQIKFHFILYFILLNSS